MAYFKAVLFARGSERSDITFKGLIGLPRVNAGHIIVGGILKPAKGQLGLFRVCNSYACNKCINEDNELLDIGGGVRMRGFGQYPAASTQQRPRGVYAYSRRHRKLYLLRPLQYFNATCQCQFSAWFVDFSAGK